MTGTLRRVVALVLVLAAVAGLLVLYRDHRREVERESARDAPVVAASRVTAEQEGTVTVTLDTAELRRVGLRVAVVGAVTRATEVALPAEVVAETERAAVLRAPVAGRFSVPEGARWPGLGERVTAGVELARVSDARPLASPISGTVTQVGAQPGALVGAGQALLEIVDLSRPLVRVAWLERAVGAPPRSLALSPGGTARVPATLIGPAPEADPVTRRPAFLYRAARTWVGAAPGVPLTAFVAGGPATGVPGESALVPDSAVVQWEGLTWAYRRVAPGRFERVRLTTDRPVPGGWLTGPPLVPGDTVVVQGAEELLSEEFRARVTVGDESGE